MQATSTYLYWVHQLHSVLWLNNRHAYTSLETPWDSSTASQVTSPELLHLFKASAIPSEVSSSNPSLSPPNAHAIQ